MIELVTDEDIKKATIYEINKIEISQIRDFFIENTELYCELVEIFGAIDYEDSFIGFCSTATPLRGDFHPLFSIYVDKDVPDLLVWSRFRRYNFNNIKEAIEFILKNRSQFTYD